MKKLIIAAIAVIAMAGCTKEVGSESYDSGSIVNFSSQSLDTRTNDAGTQWEVADQIGIFSDGFTDEYFNVAYEATQADATTPFSLVDGEDPILYPNVASGSVDFYAYYPYDAAANGESKTVDISDQSDLGLIDFMTAYESGVSYGSDVIFTFEHELAQVVFDISIKEDSGITSLEGLTAKITDIETQGSYYTYGSSQGTLASSSLTVVDDVDLAVSVADAAVTTTITAILHPATYKTPTLIFELNGTAYSVTFATTLGAGDSHTFTLTLGNTLAGFEMGSEICAWGSGTGGDLTPDVADIAYNSADDLYEIYSGQGLKAFADLVNGTENTTANTKGGITFSTTAMPDIDGKLMNNVDLSSVCGASIGVDWIPIGNYLDVDKNSTLKYSGKFYGNGKEVRNIYINNSSDYYQGLFGYVDGATISDLGVVGGSVTCSDKYFIGGVVGSANSSSVTECYNTSEIFGRNNIGGVVGWADSSLVSGCYNMGTIMGTNCVGGVVGTTTSAVTECYNTGKVSGTTNNVGGVVGYAAPSSSFSSYPSITECYNTGSVSSNGSYVGGVVGQVSSSSVTSCYSCGTVSSGSSSSYVGGVVGRNFQGNSTISYCYYDEGTVGDTNAPSKAVGGENSNNDIDDTTNVKGLTTAEMKAENVVDQLNNGAYIYNLTDTGIANPVGAWVYNAGKYPTIDASGTPTLNRSDIYDIAYNPVNETYDIYTAAGLKAFANLVNGTDDDAGATTYGVTFSATAQPSIAGKLMDDIDLSSVCGASIGSPTTEVDWIPIGDYSSGSGTSYPMYKGKFDGNGKVVKNLYINSDSNYQGLFGYVSGYTSAEVKDLGVVGGSVTGGDNVGGVVGYAYGSVSNCYNTATVNGGSYVGGVMGYAVSSISGCYNTAAVEGSGSHVGGVAGETVSSVSNCYNTVTVKGSSSVGGVVGSAIGYSGNITECYNTGKVEGSDSVGGVVGYTHSSVTECYNTGDVEGSGCYVGGVVGNTHSSVTECYNTGYIKDSGDWVGGIVGAADNTNVTECYNTGKVEGNNYVGGVVGQIVGSELSESAITSCYSCGAVSSSGSIVGGVAGYSDSYTKITYCYYDEDTVDDNVTGTTPSAAVYDKADSTGDDIATGYAGLSNTEMTDGTLYNYLIAGATAGTWSKVTDDYPILTWQVSSN